jgi:MFS family permease
MSWTCDLVPHERLGAVFGRRQLRATIAGIVAGLAGGAIVNGWAAAFPLWRVGGYAGVFGLAILSAMASTLCLTRMPEVPMAPPRPTRLRTLFAKPFRDGNFRRLMTFLGCWQFVVNLTLPFFAVYLVRDLKYSITTVIALGIVSQLASIAALPLWGRIGDTWSHKAVIVLCAPLLLCCPLGWVLAAEPAPHLLTLPILATLQLVLGVATAGLDLASGNIALKLAPRAEATVFLGANGLVKSLCAGCAPLLGGFLVDHLPGGGAVTHGRPWLVLFATAAALGVFALSRLARVEESGDRRMGLLFAAALDAARARLASLRYLFRQDDLPAA